MDFFSLEIEMERSDRYAGRKGAMGEGQETRGVCAGCLDILGFKGLRVITYCI